ncbi:uncharacterized protein [Spinacia oleracea]|uniref:Reverse transcriptase domain-containing protein n=1 Tax=Spinacia oleracea TaxID=3562 RepID=A0ABM3RPM1_SPIOL|nr:uncharacterized protein LOC130471454 [Spinacia oleracea]
MKITHLMFADDLLLFYRGDSISIGLLYASFLKFSKASSLEVNLDNSCIYLSGVTEVARKNRLEIYTCKLDLYPSEKMVQRTRNWSSKQLSYVGRLKLVKVVHLSIQNYWSQIFLLPKNIMKEVEKNCKLYLWTGSTEQSEKALVAWSNMCLPKSVRGWKLIVLPNWNKAEICNLLGAVSLKEDDLHILYRVFTSVPR